MAASIKVSELQSLDVLTDVDLFLVSDMESGTSRRVSYSDLKSNLITETANALADLEILVGTHKDIADTNYDAQVAALEAYKTYIEERNLAEGLSLGLLYVENFTGG